MTKKWGVTIKENPGFRGNCNWFEVYYQNSFPNRKKDYYRKYAAKVLDEHFVLTEEIGFAFHREEERLTIFGVAHGEEEAETRLYEAAKFHARKLIRECGGHCCDVPMVDDTSRKKVGSLEAV